MSKLFAIHSFRGGTGKSSVTACLSVLLAQKGLRVGVIDMDIQTPGIHTLFDLRSDEIQHTVNDFLWGKCLVSETVYDMTGRLSIAGRGSILLLPSSMKLSDITRAIRYGYDAELLTKGCAQLSKTFALDVIMIDTHPGLNEETLISIAISDMLIILMRLEQQDFQGTAVTVNIARKLDVTNMFVLINNAPKAYDLKMIGKDIECKFNCTLGSVLRHSTQMMALEGKGIFTLKHPNHPLTRKLRTVADMLANGTDGRKPAVCGK